MILFFILILGLRHRNRIACLVRLLHRHQVIAQQQAVYQSHLNIVRALRTIHHNTKRIIIGQHVVGVNQETFINQLRFQNRYQSTFPTQIFKIHNKWI